MSTAFIFPGQGGQFVGQGQAWLEADPSLNEIFELAEEISGHPIKRLCLEGPAEELSQTVNLQPAVLAVSLAAWRLLKADYTPAFAAGHSLGEFGALVAAGVFDEKTALTLVSKRAVLMDEAAKQNPGAMLAVMGMPAPELEAICELARNEGEVVLANFNTPEQIVISGSARAVSAAGKFIKMKKGRAIPLPVSGAFHSSFMTSAATKFAELLDKTEFKAPICPVFPNATGTATTDPAEIKAKLKEQMVGPVHWTKTVDSLLAAGATQFLEAWPKSYLGSIIKKCLPPDSQATISFQA